MDGHFTSGKLGEADAELLRGLQSGAGASGRESGVRRRVLVVDTSLPFLRSIASILESQGYEARTASSAQDARDLLEGFQPHLITLDNDMPGQPSLGTLIQIKQRMPQVKVLLVAQGLDHETATSAILNGASECISKPVDTQKLLGLIRSLIG